MTSQPIQFLGSVVLNNGITEIELYEMQEMTLERAFQEGFIKKSTYDKMKVHGDKIWVKVKK